MSWLERFCLAVLLAVLVLLVVEPARADEEISRRLAALKALVNPEVARSAARPPVVGDRCGSGAWWKATDYGVRSRTDQAVRDAGLRFGVDRQLIRSVIRHESAFDPMAVSHKGAQGMMQLMPATARSLGVVCSFDPRENILGGTRYLRRMYDRFGSWPRALAAYHAGPRRVEQRRLGPETRRYVKAVLRSWNPGRFAQVHLE